MDSDQLRSVVRKTRRLPLWDVDTGATVGFERDVVQKLIPHRDPFLLVDRVTRVDLERALLAGERTIATDDPVFAGHFPGAPVYPGVLQLETMGQYMLCLLALLRLQTLEVPPEATSPSIRAIKIHHALFAREIGPGASLTVLAEVLESIDYTAITAGQILCEGEVCSAGVMEVYFVG